jgi:hypothetical protein
MTLDDVRSCIEHVIRWDMPARDRGDAEAQVKGLNDWIAPGGKQDLSWLEKNRLGKVVKAHG